jgi:plasmid stabilization system protein ParE
MFSDGANRNLGKPQRRRREKNRHFLLYRRRSDGLIEVARILHDGRDLQLHLPEKYQRPRTGE